MPGLSAIYGLKWEDIEVMPWGELVEYVSQVDHWVSVISSGMLKPDKG
jgi:hypothetical protein